MNMPDGRGRAPSGSKASPSAAQERKIVMDRKFTELFENWHAYTQKMNEVYERLGVLLTDLGITKDEVRIITFLSSVLHCELKAYDSNGTSHSISQCLTTSEKYLAEEHLIELFNIKREYAIFSFDIHSPHVRAYDEFGVVQQGHEDIGAYGIVIQYNKLESSQIIFELLNQIILYCRNVLDNKNFVIEEYMLANIVYVALKKQIDIDFYNILAASPYEKKVISGRILLINEIQQCNLRIGFNETYPLEVKNVKQIRKLLEMTTDKLFLVSKNSQAIGIGEYKNFSGDFESFTFNGHQRWSYYKNDKELLSYKEGKYTFIFANDRNFISRFPKNFIPARHHDYLNSILHKIVQLNRGALLIISDEARSEVERLCTFGRGYPLQTLDLKLPGSRDVLSSITSIDGAIMLDTNFFCYGMGMILDGIAVKSGLNARGARYNSAQCYIDNQDYEKVVAVVVSDDETIDIIYKKA